MEKGLNSNKKSYVSENIPNESKILLVLAYLGDDQIIRVPFHGGAFFNAGGTNVTENITPQGGARWQNAFDILLGMGFIKDKGDKGEVFGLTYAGYEMVNLIKEQKIIDFSKSPQEILDEYT